MLILKKSDKISLATQGFRACGRDQRALRSPSYYRRAVSHTFFAEDVVYYRAAVDWCVALPQDGFPEAPTTAPL